MGLVLGSTGVGLNHGSMVAGLAPGSIGVRLVPRTAVSGLEPGFKDASVEAGAARGSLALGWAWVLGLWSLACNL